MTRGLTLIELLATLSLLSLLLVVVLGWTSSAADMSTRFAEPMHWSRAAEATLCLIHDDVLVGDFNADLRESRKDVKKVEIYHGQLRITARAHSLSNSSGTAVHEYHFDRMGNQLKMIESTKNGERYSRLLLDRVQDFKCEMAHSEHMENVNVLTVTITPVDGMPQNRSYLIP